MIILYIMYPVSLPLAEETSVPCQKSRSEHPVPTEEPFPQSNCVHVLSERWFVKKDLWRLMSKDVKRGKAFFSYRVCVY